MTSFIIFMLLCQDVRSESPKTPFELYNQDSFLLGTYAERVDYDNIEEYLRGFFNWRRVKPSLGDEAARVGQGSRREVQDLLQFAQKWRFSAIEVLTERNGCVVEQNERLGGRTQHVS